MIFYKDPMMFEGIWTASSDDKLWLYDDEASRADYYERLALLMSQKVRAVGKEPRQLRRVRAYQPPMALTD